MNHMGTIGNCASCHNGRTAEGKSPRHFVTTLPCESCHRTVSWTLVNYRHASMAYVAHGAGLGCSSCHTTNAQIIPWKFPAYRPDCAGCHAADYRPMPHPKFKRPITIYYTVMDLRNCAGACHVYADSTLRTIVTRRSGVHRAIGGGW